MISRERENYNPKRQTHHYQANTGQVAESAPKYAQKYANALGTNYFSQSATVVQSLKPAKRRSVRSSES